MKNIKEIDVIDKRVLVRCDFNVPLDEKGNILDDFRIRQALPTIKYLMETRGKVILMSHLGEPQGKVVPELKMDKIGEKLSEFLNVTIAKEDDCIGPEIENQTNALKQGQVLLLENLRFHKEETDNNADFGKKLSYLGDVYVNDAFSVCHRKNASVALVPQHLPHAAGFLLENEISNLNKVIQVPEKPMVVLVGGKKVETKTKFIDRISEIADFVIVSGLIKKEIAEKNIQFLNPEKIIGPEGGLNALDVDDKSIQLFTEKIMQAKTVLWNGPFGKFEEKQYAKGTLALADAIIKSKAYSLVGGGETVEFLEKYAMMDKFSYVSTGGGAMMAYLAGEEMPGLAALN